MPRPRRAWARARRSGGNAAPTQSVGASTEEWGQCRAHAERGREHGWGQCRAHAERGREHGGVGAMPRPGRAWARARRSGGGAAPTQSVGARKSRYLRESSLLRCLPLELAHVQVMVKSPLRQ